MISAFMVTRDSAPWLAAVIANLRRFADEVVVIVDDASDDASLLVARRYADRAESWLIPGGVPEAVRNEAARLCAGDWLWMADDDELIPPALARHIPILLRGGFLEYGFARKHVLGSFDCGLTASAQDARLKWITTAPWWPDYQTRLRNRVAWQLRGWPRTPHQTPPDHKRLLVNVPFWHLKFLLRSQAVRAERMAAWGRAWAPALGEHYRRFSLAEQYAWETAPMDEEAPVELADVLASIKEI